MVKNYHFETLYKI